MAKSFNEVFKYIIGNSVWKDWKAIKNSETLIKDYAMKIPKIDSNV